MIKFFAAVVAYIRSLPANEPLIIGGAVSTTLTLVATFGLNLPGPQIAAVAAGSISVTTFVMRAAVSPLAKMLFPTAPSAVVTNPTPPSQGTAQ
jgi:hypothetical protein